MSGLYILEMEELEGLIVIAPTPKTITLYEETTTFNKGIYFTTSDYAYFSKLQWTE